MLILLSKHSFFSPIINRMTSGMLMTIMTFLGSIKDNVASVSNGISKKIISLGNSAKTKIGKQLTSLLEKLGFKKPKNKKEKVKVRKEVKEAVEEEIQQLEEKQLKGELSAVSNLKSNGRFDYTIWNRSQVKNLKEFLDKCDVPQGEVVKKHLICKVNYSYHIQMFKSTDGRDENEEKHFTLDAVPVQYPEWIPDVYQEAIVKKV